MLLLKSVGHELVSASQVDVNVLKQYDEARLLGDAEHWSVVRIGGSTQTVLLVFLVLKQCSQRSISAHNLLNP
jgi:hypothetical protein